MTTETKEKREKQVATQTESGVIALAVQKHASKNAEGYCVYKDGLNDHKLTDLIMTTMLGTPEQPYDPARRHAIYQRVKTYRSEAFGNVRIPLPKVERKADQPGLPFVQGSILTRFTDLENKIDTLTSMVGRIITAFDVK